MATKYSTIPIGKIFQAKGTQYRKVDDLYYEDLSTGFQAVWNPMFDESINAPSTKPVADENNIKDKFLVDSQTRMVKPNPNYKEYDGTADKVFAEMWGTGLFDCGPADYDYIALQSVTAAKALNTLAEAVGLPNHIALFETIVNMVKTAYAAKWAADTEAATKKVVPVKKKTVKKTVAKKAPAKKGKR